MFESTVLETLQRITDLVSRHKIVYNETTHRS